LVRMIAVIHPIIYVILICRDIVALFLLYHVKKFMPG